MIQIPGESQTPCGPDREVQRRDSLAAPASLAVPGRTMRTVCDSEYREAMLEGIYRGLMWSADVLLWGSLVAFMGVQLFRIAQVLL